MGTNSILTCKHAWESKSGVRDTQFASSSMEDVASKCPATPVQTVWQYTLRLLHISILDFVLVAIFQVFTSHTPDE